MKLSLDGVRQFVHDVAVTRLPSGPVESRARWSPQRARAWQAQRPWPVGCNYLPSTAGNQLEMWQVETWDPLTIERELGWAADLGFTSIRVFLHDLLAEEPTFLDRVDELLAIADDRDLGVLLVLFDGVWHPSPATGGQPDPTPGVHNSTWVQSPGSDAIADRGRWPRLRRYVESTLERFGADPRVDGWDLFNEPDNPNLLSYADRELPGKRQAVTPLVDACFDWATEVDPDQPLTTGIWTGVTGGIERTSELNRILLARSDVISFHSYLGPDSVTRTVQHLAAYGRPIWCTEWMARPRSTVAEVLPVLHRLGVGAYSWGLVDGRSQTRFSWMSWRRPESPDRPWFHDLLHADGTPYDPAEVEVIRALTAPDADPVGR